MKLENNDKSFNKNNIKNENKNPQAIDGKNVEIKINNSMIGINKESIKINEGKSLVNKINKNEDLIENNKGEKKVIGEEKKDYNENIFREKYENNNINNNSSSHINTIINNNILNETTNKNVKNKEKIIQQKKSMWDYFKENKNFYEGKETPILNYMINNMLKFSKSFQTPFCSDKREKKINQSEIKEEINDINIINDKSKEAKIKTNLNENAIDIIDNENEYQYEIRSIGSLDGWSEW